MDPDTRRRARDSAGRAPAAARISGTAAGLYLAVWKRAPVNQLLIDGDERVGRDFLAGELTA